MQALETFRKTARALAAPAALLLAACLGGCLFGTTTESENTAVPGSTEVKGQILLSDGKPAPGARITVRTGKLEISKGIPSWALFALATADAEGRFLLTLPDTPGLFLEIREKAPIGVQADTAHLLEAYFTSLDKVVRPGGNNGTFRLERTGSLRGRMALQSGKSAAGLWLGVRGSSSLIRLDNAPDGGVGIPFSMDGVPSGAHSLTLLDLGVVSTAGYVQVGTGSPQSWTVKPDSLSDVGTIFYNDTSRTPP